MALKRSVCGVEVLSAPVDVYLCSAGRGCCLCDRLTPFVTCFSLFFFPFVLFFLVWSSRLPPLESGDRGHMHAFLFNTRVWSVCCVEGFTLYRPLLAGFKADVSCRVCGSDLFNCGIHFFHPLSSFESVFCLVFPKATLLIPLFMRLQSQLWPAEGARFILNINK